MSEVKDLEQAPSSEHFEGKDPERDTLPQLVSEERQTYIRKKVRLITYRQTMPFLTRFSLTAGYSPSSAFYTSCHILIGVSASKAPH